MSTIVADPGIAQDLISRRRELGQDRWDEVWEGDYIIMPPPNDEHQDLVGGLCEVLRPLIQRSGRGVVRPGVSISDRVENWTSNYRVPDVAVFLDGTTTENHGTFWCGGPDFAVEIVSPDDRSRQKFDFYESIGTRELLLIDRDPWQLELFQLTDGQLQLAGVTVPTEPTAVVSQVLSLTWRLIEGEQRPQIEIATLNGDESWTV